MLKTIEKVFQEVFGDEQLKISNETNPEDIEAWDSFKHISIMAEIERVFHVQFTIDEIIGIGNVGDMIESISRKNM